MINKKVAMLGMWGVGKTSLVRQFVHSAFEEKYLSTLGVKVDKKTLRVAEQDVNLMLWDIAGAEDHFSVPMHYVKGSAGYLLVVDGTRKSSLQAAADLVDKIDHEIGQLPYVVVINKNDLQWEVSTQDIEAAFAGRSSQWFSTSAKTGENVEAAFARLAELVLSSPSSGAKG